MQPRLVCCQTKVCNLCTESRINEDVLRLEIAMEDWRSGGMQESKALCDVSNNLQYDFTTSVQRLVPKQIVPEQIENVK
jgi:hypothetical protein